MNLRWCLCVTVDWKPRLKILLYGIDFWWRLVWGRIFFACWLLQRTPTSTSTWRHVRCPVPSSLFGFRCAACSVNLLIVLFSLNMFIAVSVQNQGLQLLIRAQGIVNRRSGINCVYSELGFVLKDGLKQAPQACCWLFRIGSASCQEMWLCMFGVRSRQLRQFIISII